MKVTGWTWWDNPEYKDMFPIGDNTDWDKIDHVEKLVAAEMRANGYKFTGTYHQNGDFGVPIIDDKWLYQCSCRTWGYIMVMAYPEEIDDKDGYGYVQWAWSNPEGQKSVVPELLNETA